MSEEKRMTEVEMARKFREEMDSIPEEQLLKEIEGDILKHRKESGK